MGGEDARTSTIPTATQTKTLTAMRVMMMAIARNGSLFRYGTREW